MTERVVIAGGGTAGLAAAFRLQQAGVDARRSEMSSNPLDGVGSLCEAFQRTATVDAGTVALRTVGGTTAITWRDYVSRVRDLAAGLAELGIGRGDTVGLMMTNRPEFNLCDTAALHLGAVPFSVYNTLPADDITHLFDNAANRVVICEPAFLERIRAVGEKVEHIICVDGAADGALSLADLEERGRQSSFDVDAAWRAVGPDDLLTLIYTSGTTGPPKGVELTHANMLAELRATTAILPVEWGDRVSSYLPAAHIADRWSTHYQSLAYGLQITTVADPAELAAALADVHPTVWGAVPRVWEKLKAALESRFATELDAERSKAVAWALDAGRRTVQAEQAVLNGEGPGPDEALLAEYAEADDLVLSKIRAQLGLDQTRWSVSGAAPASLDVLEFFGALGLPISEIWGMSELAAVGTVSPPAANKLGTVGVALPGVELRLADDGELLCRGPQVMRGYRNDPDKTAEAIDADGWLHTGDVAEIDTDSYVRIVDRKKELIINAAGKNMSPANIENKLKGSSPLIGQAVAIGDGRPYNVALIVLDHDACVGYAAQQGMTDGSPGTLARNAEVLAALADAVRLANEPLARIEQVKAYAVLPDEWAPGGDELTPTMKIKRRVIAEKYAEQIAALYR